MNNVFIAAHALIVHDDKILLLKRSMADNYWPGFWDIPGGTVEFGEIIEYALQREVKEETGLQIKHANPIYVYTNNSEIPQRQTFQIVMKCNLVENSLVMLSNEHSEYKWIKYDEIKKHECIGFLAGLANTYKLVK